MARTKKLTQSDVRQRAGTAREHLQVALERKEYIDGQIGPSAEAQVCASNAISAGIAAADAICGAVLGERANDQDHTAAADLLAAVQPNGPALAKLLRRLLTDKSQLQYGGYCTAAVARKMTGHAEVLVGAMKGFGI